mmetsp:Transcript_31618/g.68096  ORF Transcript_31618/g.68096 Transcript_31618/m.68096 type:complete len:276 (+) Transcript_31618:98-925(+)
MDRSRATRCAATVSRGPPVRGATLPGPCCELVRCGTRGSGAEGAAVAAGDGTGAGAGGAGRPPMSWIRWVTTRCQATSTAHKAALPKRQLLPRKVKSCVRSSLQVMVDSWSKLANRCNSDAKVSARDSQKVQRQRRNQSRRKKLRRSRVSRRSESCKQWSLLPHNHRPPRTCCTSRRQAARALLIKVVASRRAPTPRTSHMDRFTLRAAHLRVHTSKSRFQASKARSARTAVRRCGSSRVKASQLVSKARRRESAARLEDSARTWATAQHQAVML